MSDAPEPLIEIGIEPKAALDQQKLSVALRTLAVQDLAFSYSIDAESNQIIIKGRSLQQLERAADRLSNEFGVPVNVGAPQAAYREALTRRFEIDHTHKKVLPNGGEFARVTLVFEPLAPGSGYVFQNEVRNGAVPDDCIPGIVRGLDASRVNGVAFGYPLIDLKATLIDGAFHDIDSSARTFEIAARAAFHMLKEHKAVKLVEPIMRVEVTTPDDCLGSVIGDLDVRRARVLSIESSSEHQIVIAQAPLEALFTFDEALRAISRERATATMTFSHYDEAPRSIPDDDPPRFPPAIGMRA